MRQKFVEVALYQEPSFLQSLGSFISKHPIAAAAGFAALAAAVKYLPSVIQRALSSEVGGMTP